MKIRITATTTDRRRSVQWIGDSGWLSLPARGDTWFHCGEWTGEEFTRVSWAGPGDPVAHSIEVQTDDEVITHLVAEHGFSDG